MALKNQLNFASKIDGVGVSDIKLKLNYELETYEDRMVVVNDTLEYGDKFYQEYFDEHCSVDIMSNDFLLSENNVVRSLESIANYILAKDPEYNNTDSNYFVRSEQLDKKMVKEDEFCGTSASVIDELELESDYEEQPNNDNFKKLKKQSIKAEDLKRSDMLGDILNDYNVFLELIKKYTKINNNDDGVKVKHLKGKKTQRFMYSKHQSSVKDDMIICKDSMMKTHGYTLKYFSESTQPDYDMIDVTDKEHLLGKWITVGNKKTKVNGLLSFKATDDYQNDFNCILIDLQNTIDECDLNTLELEVLELYRKGMKPHNIAQELNTNSDLVNRKLNSIADKIIERL